VIIGAALILAAIVVTLAVRDTSREKAHISRTLLEKGTAIIKAFESGARAGMGMRWGGEQFQTLIEELSDQSGLFYLAVVDEDGRVLAHSNRDLVGRTLYGRQELDGLGLSPREQWRVTSDGQGRRVFEIFRLFAPMAGRMPRENGRMHHDSCFMPDGQPAPAAGKQAVFLGLDIGPFDDALAEDMRTTVILSAVLLLLGMAGVLSLFWASSYRASTRLLHDTRAFASEIVSNLPVGLVTTDAQGRIAVMNGAAQRITGLKADEAIGRAPDEVLPPDWCRLADLPEEGEPVIERETECRFGGGKPVPLSVSASKIVNEEGGFLGNVVIFRDLGEVRRLQEEVRRRERLAALGNLAAGVAHEIRNPLSSIKGFAKYFEGHCAEGSEGRELAAIMTREVDRLNRVVTELLDFARPTDLKSRPTDVSGLIEHSLRLIRQDAAARGVEVEFRAEPSLPRVDVDPDRFAQALLNLYLNGIQAMDGGGRLAVRAMAGGGNSVRIEVEDTGRGIPAGDLKDIFNPYFTTKPSGTGLGLANVHKVVEAHRGEIKVGSVPGKGTTFTILVPIHGSREETHGRQA
jgi:two-component system sensor histidine kinase HydH